MSDNTTTETVETMGGIPMTELIRVVQAQDPTRLCGNCTCRIVSVLWTSDKTFWLLLGSEDDCPVHGFGDDTQDE